MNGETRDENGNRYELSVFNTPNSTGGHTSQLLIQATDFPGYGLQRIDLRGNQGEQGVPAPLTEESIMIGSLTTEVQVLRADVVSLKEETLRLQETVEKLLKIRRNTNLTVSKEER
tara:strand:+ start:353 stop:700 length:348 start_codon:yes stop_codon:yes gene_type:complete